MNLLFIANTNKLYGANQSMLNLIKYLLRSGHKVWVMLPRNGMGEVTDELDKIGCPYFKGKYYSCVSTSNKAKLKYFLNWFFLPILYFKIKRLNIDIIHTNTSTIDIGAMLAELFHIPHVWHVRELLAHYGMKYIMPNVYKRFREQSSRVICISKTVYDSNSKEFDTSNMVVIYNGFTVDKENVVERHFADKTIHLLEAGIISPSKGQDEAIEAMNILVNQMQCKNVFLTIKGEATRAYLKELLYKVEMYNLEKYVEIKPFDRNLNKTLNKYDITLQCSRLEGLGRVTIESMLAGVLVVGARSGATEELITDGVNGFLYSVGIAQELAEKIRYAILHKEESEQIIRNAEKWAIQRFHNDKVSRQIEEEYLKIV